MKNLFSVSQTAKLVGVTAETLRHYDRIGLVRPCQSDPWTGYRYYSQQEIVRLRTIRALRCMDLPLNEIKELLEYRDFDQIVSVLLQAEANADRKIAELQNAKAAIERARTFYQSKANGGAHDQSIFVERFDRRVILLSDTLRSPSLEDLWDYHRHFYAQLPDDRKDAFSFEDTAGIYRCDGQTQLFAVCTRYEKIDRLRILPEGRYLCGDCTAETREQVMETLLETAKRQHKVPPFALEFIVLTGILHWNYQVQLYID